MYTRPIIFKIYSIIVIVFAILGFISSVTQLFIPNDLLSSLIPSLEAVLTIIKIVSVIASMITLFFGYMEFSSMYTFADMIKHENNNNAFPFEANCLTLKPKTYTTFGLIVFSIILLSQVISIGLIVIITSSELKQFIVLPLLPVFLCMLFVLFAFITYYLKYKAFGTLLEILSSNEPSKTTVDELKYIKPSMLKGFGIFLLVISGILTIGLIVALIKIFMIIIGLFEVGIAIAFCFGVLVLGAIIILLTVVLSLYYNNLAKMLEHYMIKYKLI